MNSATITEAKNGLSRLLDEVRHGQTIVITDRHRPIARLSPVSGEEAGDATGRILRMERAGLLTPARKRVGRRGGLEGAPPTLSGGASAVKALLDEREAGR